MKTVAVLLLFIITASLPAYAEEEVPEAVITPHREIIVKLADMPADESEHYAFQYGFQAILEKKCDGAFLTLTEGGDYVGGFLTENAPDDFCVRISTDTLVVAEPIVKDLAMAMYGMLGDRMSISSLMNCSEEYVIGIIMFRPEEGMVVTPLWYAEAENLLKEASIAVGLNPDELYSIMAEQGYDRDSLVASVDKGVSATDIALDAVKIKKDNQTASAKEKSFFFRSKIIRNILLLEGAGLVLLFLYLIISSVTGKRFKSEEEND